MMQRTFSEEIRYQFKSGPMFTRLILVNLFVFLIINFILLIYFLNNIPSELASFKLLSIIAPTPSWQHNLTHPWSIILYMFSHIGFFHLLFNMMLLYFGGKIFSQYLSDKQLLNVYIFGGLCGLLFFIVSYNTFPVFANSQMSPIIGASASVMAVLGAISFYLPKLEVMLWGVFRMRLIYLTLIFAALDFISIPKDNAGGRIAHLGGLLFGLYASMYFKNSKHVFNRWDLTSIFFVSRWFKRKSKLKVKYSNKNSRGMSDEDYNLHKKAKQERIDEILDKINRSGYESLSKAERDFLFNAGKN